MASSIFSLNAFPYAHGLSPFSTQWFYSVNCTRFPVLQTAYKSARKELLDSGNGGWTDKLYLGWRECNAVAVCLAATCRAEKEGAEAKNQRH